jgi:hypothetical protein
LLGTRFDVPTGSYTTLNGATTFPANKFDIAFNPPAAGGGFINSNAKADDAQNFFNYLKDNQFSTNVISAYPPARVLGISIKGPSGDFCPYFYNSSNPTHNPNSYDLWVDVSLNGKTQTFGNWKKD